MCDTLITALRSYSEYFAQRFVHLELTHFYMRIEFQQRVSPHVHSLLWIENAPKYVISPLNDVIEFIDRTITCKLPNTDSLLSLMVKLIYNIIITLIHVIRGNHSDVVDLVFLTHLWFKLKF